METLVLKPDHIKTRRGKILKIVRENYLRSDIKHGLESANGITKQSCENTLGNCLNFNLNPCLIIINTEICLNQMDILESEVVRNVIICQTVLKEVKRKSLNIYKRVRALIREKEKHFFVFSNEHSIDTFKQREPKENSRQYDNRLIRSVAKFYSTGKLAGNKTKTLEEAFNLSVCLVTDDQENLDLAKNDNILAISTEKWVRSMPEDEKVDILFDKISRVDLQTDDQKIQSQDGDDDSKASFYSQHLPLSQLQAGIKAGNFIQGKININPDNPSVGKMFNDKYSQILIQGLQALNRSVDGDLVCIKLLEKEKWQCEIEEFDDLKSAPEISNKDDIPANGKVVGIIKRNWRQYCGMIDDRDTVIENSEKNHADSGLKIFFLPADPKLPRIEIETRQLDRLKGQRIVVCIDAWPRHAKNPIGHYVRTLGKIGDKNAEREVVLLEHEVPHEAFSKTVMNCLPKEGTDWKFNENEHMDLGIGNQRMDLRHLPICSVDPPGCTDIDDTLHCVQFDENWSDVGVHIADVSHFIKPNTALDEEARNRGTTVYLCDQRIDMVPGLLSGNLCSMRDDGDRLGFSVLWRINHFTGEIDDSKTVFTKSVVRSRKSYTYEEAQLKDLGGKLDSVFDLISFRVSNSFFHPVL